jgi:membrane protease YdiL (CAAX protease family)
MWVQFWSNSKVYAGHSGKPMSRRLTVLLAVSFLLTWTCWWILVPLARARKMVYGHPSFMLLYVLGGSGPTIAAYVAVLATRSQAPLREFHSRLFRWRVAARWYVIAVALPVAIALASLAIAIVVNPELPRALSFRPWYMFFPLLLMMVVGGGLEELGWRGVAQPEMERALPRPVAAVLVGMIWSLWHLPLFSLPGVGQYQTDFAVFMIFSVGGALILAWLYGRTESILLCILFHASWNAGAALGLAIPSDRHLLAVLDSCLRVVVGALLLTVGSALSVQPSAARLNHRH